jgi:hypothetical protein
VRRYIEFDDLAEAATRLHVLVFAVTEGCEVLLSEGPAVDVILCGRVDSERVSCGPDGAAASD